MNCSVHVKMWSQKQSLLCGGCNYLYVVVLVSQLTMAGVSGDDTVTPHIGCYKENENRSQLLKGFQKNFPVGSLTIQKCINLCYRKGFRYAGIQYEVECFCGNVRPSFTTSAGKGDRLTKRSGNSNQICGRGWPIRLHETGIKGPPSEAIENYVGCFKDELQRRLLSGYFQDFPNDLTPEICVRLCYRMGFLYAGVAYSTECHCGDKHPSPSDLAPEGECQKSCSGDSSKKCGGDWIFSIYETTISDIPEAGKLIGCYVDARNNRVMKEFKIDLFKTNSPRRCLNLCLQLGYHYSGVEYGRECFCSNDRPSGSGIVSDENCNFICPGDPGQICGGRNRIYVFRTGIDTENKAEKCLLDPLNTLDTTQPVTTSSVTAPTLLPKPIITIPMELEKPEELHVDDNSVTTFNGRKASKGKVIFEDNFIDDSNFQSNWKHSLKLADKPDYEFCEYTGNSANSYIRNGMLMIKTLPVPDDLVKSGKIQIVNCTGRPKTVECELEAKSYQVLAPVRCARLNTRESFTFKYGIVEIVAKMPSGDWLVPELWLDPKSNEYGEDYRSGRIRIAMARGNENLTINSEDISNRKIESGILMGTSDENVRGRTISRINDPGGWHNDFHNFTLVWTPDNLSFLVDGQQEYSLLPSEIVRLSDTVGFNEHESEAWKKGTALAPFDKEFYISLGLSIGGVRDFPDNCVNRGKPKPWRNLEVKATLKFWLDRKNWLPTWSNVESTFYIRSVKVTAI